MAQLIDEVLGTFPCGNLREECRSPYSCADFERCLDQCSPTEQRALMGYDSGKCFVERDRRRAAGIAPYYQQKVKQI